MKFSLVPLIALAFTGTSVMALPEPTPTPTTLTPTVGKRALEKRSNSGRIEVDGLKYRLCPRVSDCTANGQYPIGTHVDIVCYTRENTTVINGDAGWAKLTNAQWVALSFGQYVSWTGGIQYCTKSQSA